MMIFVSFTVQQEQEDKQQQRQALAFHLDIQQNKTIPEARKIVGSIENQLNITRQALREANLTDAFFHLGLAQQELAVLGAGNSTIGMYNVLPAPQELASSFSTTFQAPPPPPPPSIGSFSSSPSPPFASSQPSLSSPSGEVGGTLETIPTDELPQLEPSQPTTQSTPSTQIIRPGESFQTTQPSLGSQPSISSQPSQSIRPSSPTQPSQPTQPTQPSQPTQPVIP